MFSVPTAVPTAVGMLEYYRHRPGDPCRSGYKLSPSLSIIGGRLAILKSVYRKPMG